MKKIRILIVDDESEITNKLKELLERTGRFEVLAETSGAAALRSVRQFKPELAILDEMMDGMYGSELKLHLQQMPEFKHLPIIYFSAIADDKNDKEVFIKKPAKFKRIIEVIDQQLSPASQASV